MARRLPIDRNGTSARPEISGLVLTLAVTAFIMAVYNNTFWSHAYTVFEGNLWRIAMFGLTVWALTLFTLSLLGFRWLQKPVLAGLLVLSAATSYYMDNLGVMIDRDMIRNVMLTTVNESRHLMTASFVTQMVAWGLLPAALVLWVRVRPQGFLRNLFSWAGTVAVSLALFLGLLFTDFKAYSAAVREHRELMGSYQPGAPLAGAYNYVHMITRNTNVVVQPLGTDATSGPLLAAADKPVLTVVMLGETARAQDFGLDGYARQTTPELAARNVINFANVSACGTSTAISVPCMFSPFGHDGYSYDRAVASENLLDVLAHAGVVVEWWDNNTGDQGNAKRVTSVRLKAEDDPAACASGECTDDIFLPVLRRTMETMTRDTVLVMHMIGSHGPSYYLRYPPAFEAFTPACHTSEFADCTAEEIVNAYDNTILYTDHILGQAIDMMAAQDRVLPAMLYVSDHGESLGENGLYLHGAPYFMAPEEQTHVPMVLWMSPAFQEALRIDPECLGALEQTPISHDNIFHTVLGLMDIRTTVRDATLDLSGACRSEQPA